MVELIIAIVLIVALFALFFITYVLNKKTPVPDSCKDIETEQCEGCHQFDCAFKKIDDIIEEEKKK